MDDESIRALVARLARPHRSGGAVIERAAILASGSDSTEVLTWITAHDGKAEDAAATSASRGLHSARLGQEHSGSPTPLRFVLPPGALTPTAPADGAAPVDGPEHPA